ncbi:MAG TPA: hypothetical protein VGR76_10280 [Candidatus Angelobacter sp.]|jgi:cyclopropane fatty-acyl-phospholipid synthase-like methyltransferase|nr:hypothetical protein [Candidatus Angelobacter sp.]
MAERAQAVETSLVGELKGKIWRLYLAGSAHYFQSGKLDLYLTLLVSAQMATATCR